MPLWESTCSSRLFLASPGACPMTATCALESSRETLRVFMRNPPSHRVMPHRGLHPPPHPKTTTASPVTHKPHEHSQMVASVNNDREKEKPLDPPSVNRSLDRAFCDRNPECVLDDRHLVARSVGTITPLMVNCVPPPSRGLTRGGNGALAWRGRVGAARLVCGPQRCGQAVPSKAHPLRVVTQPPPRAQVPPVATRREDEAPVVATATAWRRFVFGDQLNILQPDTTIIRNGFADSMQ